MRKFALILIMVTFLVTSVNVCLAEKGRDPPDPPAVPPFEQVDRSLSTERENPPGPPVSSPSGVSSRKCLPDRSDP